jgi:hypothetical protein
MYYITHICLIICSGGRGRRTPCHFPQQKGDSRSKGEKRSTHHQLVKYKYIESNY